MYQTKLFKKNCERWALFYPEQAKKLNKDTYQRLVVTKSADGSANLHSNVRGESIFYHSTQNPILEASEWFAKADLHNVNVLYVFGVGLGYIYDAAKAWLHENKNRALVFLEDDLEVIYHLLHTPRARDMLYDKQVRLAYLDDSLLVIRELTTTFALKHFTTLALDLYAQARKTAYEQIRAGIAFFMDPKMSAAKEYADHGRRFLSNYFQNLLKLSDAAVGAKLFGQFTNIPAIICGAGPSLGKNLELLSTLRDQAIIFAGGTAMNALNTIGFLPHFGVGIDPNPAQFTRLVMNQAFEVPYFFSNRLLPEALTLLHGKHIFVTGATGYSVSEWFEEQLDVKSTQTLDEGCSVLNFSLSIAEALGCNPIIFVGADLAYTKQKSYAPGIHNHPIHLRKAYFVTKSAEEDVIVKTDIFGEPINTLSKWKAESYFVTKFAEQHKNLTIINATEGGLGFINIANRSLQEVANSLLQKHYDFDGMIQDRLEKARIPPQVTQEAIKECLRGFMQSLERCEILCSTLQNEYEELEAKIRLENKIFSLSEPGKKALQSLEKEPGYIFLLKQFSEKYLKMRQLLVEDIKYEAEKLGPVETQSRKTHFDRSRWGFLKITAKINVDVLTDILKQDSYAMMPSSGQRHSLPKATEGAFMPDPAAEVHREYYLNGQVAVEQFYQDGVLHGPSRFFDEAGALLSYHQFIHGKREGEGLSYTSDGILTQCQRYKDGCFDGLQETFYPDGSQKSVIPYKAGLIHGEVRLYYPSGILKRKLTFAEGKRHGIEQIWNEKGTLIIEAEFSHDMPSGYARQWYSNGQKALEIVYEKDPSAFAIQEWDETGVPRVTNIKDASDYFDEMAEQTGLLTGVLNKLVEQIKTIEPVVNRIRSFAPTSSEESIALENIHTELEHFKKIGQELMKKSGLDPSYQESELYWKGPARQREVERQMRELIAELSKKLMSIQTTLTKLLKRFANQKP